jgi:hypothetical protein
MQVCKGSWQLELNIEFEYLMCREKLVCTAVGDAVNIYPWTMQNRKKKDRNLVCAISSPTLANSTTFELSESNQRDKSFHN